ncbi:MAG: hypothetical protein IT434_02830 [Phycisphaerales bacterium]|nr:hypothetical protein [Phycisphaerales bacterium]
MTATGVGLSSRIQVAENLFKVSASPSLKTKLRLARVQQWEEAGYRFERYSSFDAADGIAHATSRLIGLFDDESIDTECRATIDDLRSGPGAEWQVHKSKLRSLVKEAMRPSMIRRVLNWVCSF